MNSAFNAANRAFDAWLSRRCSEALAAEVLKLWGDAAPEESFADARRRLASFLSGVFAGAQAAGDEVVADIADDEVDFAAIADKWLRGASEDGC